MKRYLFELTDINFFKIIFPLIKKNLFYLFSLFLQPISFGDFTIISFFKSENRSKHCLPSLLYKLISCLQI